AARTARRRPRGRAGAARPHVEAVELNSLRSAPCLVSKGVVLLRIRCAVVAVVVMFAGACGGSTSPSAQLDLSGVWYGMLGQPQWGSALRIIWTATEPGATVSDPATFVKGSQNVPATGTMIGTLSGNQLTLTYSVPAGTVPVFLSCTIA